MELVPPTPEHAVNEDDLLKEHAHRKWVGRMALRAPSDPYGELGGGLPSRYPDADAPRYPTGLDETVLFADRRQRESVPGTHVEILRAYDLSLDKLSPDDFEGLSIMHQNMVAVAGHDLLSTVTHRAAVLAIDGNFDHPAFAHYGFQVQEEANEYARQLSLLHHDLMTRDVVINIESTYNTLKTHSRAATLKEMTKQVRHLIVRITDDHKVQVGYK